MRVNSVTMLKNILHKYSERKAENVSRFKKKISRQFLDVMTLYIQALGLFVLPR